LLLLLLLALMLLMLLMLLLLLTLRMPRTQAAANIFPGCTNIPLRDMIRAGTGGVPTTLVNDADAAVGAECWVGAARDQNGSGGVKDLVFLTLGSGIGAGMVVDGKVIGGSTGTIEGGHMIVDGSGRGRPCGCGSSGCLEAYASANSVVKRALEALEVEAAAGAIPLSVLAAKGDALSCKDVFDASKSGDELAAELVKETARYLAVGVINFCRITDPEMIVLAGGMAEAGEELLSEVHKDPSRCCGFLK